MGKGTEGLRPLAVDIEEVVAALDHMDRSKNEHFLNAKTGDVITISVALMRAVKRGVRLQDTDLPQWVVDDAPLARAALGKSRSKHLIRIPAGTGIDMDDLRFRFVQAIKSPGVVEQFANAVIRSDDGKLFNQLLKNYPNVSAAWYRLEARHKNAWACKWLESNGIEAI
jgi:hypothetical protein